MYIWWNQVKWNDAYSGYGEHYWEYNHADGYKAPAYEAPAYAAPAYSAPGYSENIPSFEPAPAGKQ
jgi:hypothetical protein